MSATVTPDMKGIVERAVASEVVPDPYKEAWKQMAKQAPTQSEEYLNRDTWSTAVPATFVIRAPYGDSDTAWPTYGPGNTNSPPSCAVRKAARAERKRLKKDKQRHKKGR
jgi:hypothetical protein